MKKNESKLNATARCEKKGMYFNLYIDIPTKEGENITLLVKPLCKDNKQLSKLLYKVYKTLGE